MDCGHDDGHYYESCHACIEEEQDKLIAKHEKVTEAARRLAYELEGGDGWPVDYSDDKHVWPALTKLKEILKKIGKPIPPWERDGPGFKRRPLLQELIAGPAKEEPADDA